MRQNLTKQTNDTKFGDVFAGFPVCKHVTTRLSTQMCVISDIDKAVAEPQQSSTLAITTATTITIT